VGFQAGIQRQSVDADTLHVPFGKEQVSGFSMEAWTVVLAGIVASSEPWGVQ
jgi:hypothetical protein